MKPDPAWAVKPRRQGLWNDRSFETMAACHGSPECTTSARLPRLTIPSGPCLAFILACCQIQELELCVMPHGSLVALSWPVPGLSWAPEPCLTVLPSNLYWLPWEFLEVGQLGPQIDPIFCLRIHCIFLLLKVSIAEK